MEVLTVTKIDFADRLIQIDEHFNNSETAQKFIGECAVHIEIGSSKAVLEKYGKPLLTQTDNQQIKNMIQGLIDSCGNVADPNYTPEQPQIVTCHNCKNQYDLNEICTCQKCGCNYENPDYKQREVTQ